MVQLKRSSVMIKKVKKLSKSIFFKFWYSYVSKVDKNAEVTFMNYGYSKDNHSIELDEKDKLNRYSTQLYHFVAGSVDIQGKDILEIGCGRGGGISYVSRYMSPKSATGLDLNKNSIEFCKQYYSKENIRFVRGNAERLGFKENSFDVVINVESSHRYLKMENFLNEAYRVLKPGGFLLFADFRPDDELDLLDHQLKSARFIPLKNEIITANVLEALELTSTERQILVRKLTPKMLHRIGDMFATTKGTPTFNKLATHQFEYLFYMLKKSH
jgi:ubiquinone/menaquinone biosynthesis C-methylase UbiE